MVCIESIIWVSALICSPTNPIIHFIAAEIADIFLHFTAKNPPRISFPTEKRTGLKRRKCSRFKSSAFRTNQWRYRGRCDSIRFTVSRRIFLTGIGLFGSSNGPHEYKVSLEVKRQDSVIHEEKTTFLSDGSSSLFPVLLTGSAVQIDAGTIYTICATILGTELSYFGQDGMEHVRCEPDIHFQFYSSAESTNGTGVQGGQIAELLFVCPSISNTNTKLVDLMRYSWKTIHSCKICNILSIVLT